MKPVFLLVHGWGFDATFWSPVQQMLGPEASLAWDLGFFGNPSQPPLPPGRPVVAVGHSFGLLWLLRHRPVSWQALVSINGFTCFARRENFPAGFPLRPLQRMIQQCAVNPQRAATDFRARCGHTAPPPATLCPASLLSGLHALADWDARPALPQAALCGTSDPLIPAAMSESSFPRANILWHAGGHILPLQDPAWCAAQLNLVASNLL
jgi:pimeloyl-[acyl-carrier protein] methyl ester esterase